MKRKKLVLKIMSFLTVISILVSFSATSAFAEGNSKDITLDMIIGYAEKWADEMYDDSQVSIDEITPLLAANDNLNGYHITFKNGSVPAGYIVLKIDGTLEDPLAEYSLEGEGIVNYFNQKVNEITNSVNYMSNSDIAEAPIYNTQPLVYYKKVKVNNKEKAVFASGKQVDCDSAEFKEVLKVSKSYSKSADNGGSWDSIMDFNNAPGIIAETKIIADVEKFTPSVMDDLVVTSGAGNCVPTCATNIAAFFDECRSGNTTLISGSRQGAYNAIVSKIGKEHDIYHKDGLNGLKDYCASRGYLLSYDDYWLDLWGDFTRDVKSNKPIWVSVGVGDEGHSMMCVGYVIRSVSGKKTNYLRVATGWSHDIGSVAQFNGFDRLNGYSLTIKNISG